MGFFNNLNDKLQNFMVGRNGGDRLARWAIGAGILVMIVNLFLNNIVLMAISYALLFYCVFRIFSKDTAARAREDERFSEFLDRMAFWNHRNQKGNAKSRSKAAGSDMQGRGGKSGSPSKNSDTQDEASKAHAAKSSKMKVTCDGCGQSLSVPKGRGTLKVTCPKCHHQMKVKS